MPRKISFINYKGGVGKTSLVVNIAASLAQAGKRVLLVDLDAQSNSSIWLMRLERWNPLNTADAGHLYSIFEPGVCRLSECVEKDVVRGKEGEPLLPGLDIIPTTFTLVDLEHDYESPDGRPAFAIFQEQLAEIEDDYDFILFDCPPNVLYSSQCGVFCSGEIYVPANPDALSLIGFRRDQNIDRIADDVHADEHDHRHREDDETCLEQPANHPGDHFTSRTPIARVASSTRGA